MTAPVRRAQAAPEGRRDLVGRRRGSQPDRIQFHMSAAPKTTTAQYPRPAAPIRLYKCPDGRPPTRAPFDAKFIIISAVHYDCACCVYDENTTANIMSLLMVAAAAAAAGLAERA
jgi:hypothetical protein